MQLKQLSIGGSFTAQVYDFKRLEYTDEGKINLVFYNGEGRTEQEAKYTCYIERPQYIDEYHEPKENVLIKGDWVFIDEE